jgi:predicted nucleotidyltransferase
MDRQAIQDVLRSRLAESDADVLCAYLFGSVARDEGRADSDLDVAVLLARDPPPTLEGLQTGLADALSEAAGRTVDLVVLNDAPPDLVHRVLRDGVLLLERDRSARIRFEVKARNEYFDLLPYLQRYRRGSRGDTA